MRADGAGDGLDPCPSCHGQPVTVVDSRYIDGMRRRRRRCPQCNHRWTTVEVSIAELKAMREALVLMRQFRGSIDRAIAHADGSMIDDESALELER